MSKKIVIQLLSMLILFQCGCIVTAHTRSILSSQNESKFVNDGILDTRSLPPFGKGYRTYSYLGSALGRQYAHSLVIKTLEETFSNLHEETGRTFDVAEIGHREGGTFQPHKTHQMKQKSNTTQVFTRCGSNFVEGKTFLRNKTRISKQKKNASS